MPGAEHRELSPVVYTSRLGHNFVDEFEWHLVYVENMAEKKSDLQNCNFLIIYFKLQYHIIMYINQLHCQVGSAIDHLHHKPILKFEFCTYAFNYLQKIVNVSYFMQK